MPYRLFSILLLFCLGCGNDNSTPTGSSANGSLEGFCTVAGEPASVFVAARTLPYSPADTISKVCRADSTGWYSMELQAGTYGLYVSNETCSIFSHAPIDTVHITTEPVSHNLSRTRFSAEFEFPEFMTGQEIRCRLEGFNQYYQGSTIEDGTAAFLFPVVNPGNYNFWIKVDSVQYWHPGSFDANAAEPLLLTGDSEFSYFKAYRQFSLISGTLGGGWDPTRFDRALITAFNSDSIAVGACVADSDGSYRLSLFEAQPIKIVSSVEGMENWDGGDSFAEASIVNVPAGQHMSGLFLGGSSIECQLNPPENMFVRSGYTKVVDDSGREYPPIQISGTYATIPNLNPGSYKLYVYGYHSFSDWAPTWYQNQLSFENAELITVGELESASVSMTLVPGGKIAGNLIRHSDDSSEEWILSIYPDLDHNTDRARFVQQDLSYELTGLGAGDYRLALEYENEEMWWYPGTSILDSATVITLTGTESVTNPDWTTRPMETRPGITR
jgi:DNA gyrase inhibitor GyrI